MTSAILGTVVLFLGPDALSTRAWHESYATALEEVQRVDRPLFVVFAPGSSLAGRRLGSGQYFGAEVEEALAADYVRMIVDTETESGRMLADQFGNDGLPRMVVVDRTGRWQVYKRSGEPSNAELLRVLALHRLDRIAGRPEPVAPEPRLPVSGVFSRSVRLCRT